MPTHIHLLIKPQEGTSLSNIMHWIKLQSAKRLNFSHGSKDHVWGSPYFARAVKDHHDYETLMEYIDQNPVKANLAATPSEWKASGAFYKAHKIEGLVDFEP
jgi:REP element-mobilizing transposase RayT